MSQPDGAPPPGVKVGKRTIPRRTLIIGGAALTAVILAVAYWRRASQANQQPVSDPTTGSDTGDSAYHNPVPDAIGNGGTSGDDSVIVTNSEWTNKALTAFEQWGIYDPVTAGPVLAKYLAGISLTSDEAAIVRTAWGLVGHPTPDVPLVLTTTGPQPGTGGPNPAPTPNPPPKPKRRYVITVKFTTKNPPWNSYVDGIAAKTGRSKASLMQWNALSDPRALPIGIKFWVDPPGDYSGSVQYNG